MKIIFDYNRTLFNPDTDTLYDGALELLNELSKKHILFLISKNEPKRRSKIKNLKITKFFEKILFVEKKTPSLFLKLTKNDQDVLIVGDRIHSEISVGNSLGFKTVWVTQGIFSKEIPKNIKESPDHQIKNISELINIIKIYE